MSYEAWRISYQSDEQAGRAAYNAWKRAVAEGDAMAAARPKQLSGQVGGTHYEGAIQPVEYIEANGLPFLEGCVIKRLTRHARPGGKGLQDIDKSIHELQLLRQLRYGDQLDGAGYALAAMRTNQEQGK